MSELNNITRFGALALAVGLATTSFAQSASLEEITVTAQKRAQDAQEIGISLNSFDGDDALRFGNDIGALAGQSPGVEAYGNGMYIQSFFIRGTGLNEFAGNFNAPVAIHFDEVYVSKNWQAARPVFDVNRIEVLKGPQGTLFGRNTTGGSANYFFNEPSAEFEAYVRAEADEHERYNLQGAVSGALGENVSGRLAFYSGFGSGGPQFNLFTNDEHGTPDVNQFRGTLKWDLDSTTVKLMAYAGSDQSDQVAYKGPGIFSTTGPGLCAEVIAGQVSFAPDTCSKFNGLAALNGLPELEIEPGDIHTVNQNRAGTKDDSFAGGYIRVEHDFGPTVLTSITSIDQYERNQQEDSDGTPVASNDLYIYNDLDQFTQELRLSGTAFDDRSNYVVGVFYQKDDLRQVDSLELGTATPFNLPPANAGLPPRLVGIFDQEIDSIAAFINNEYALTDQLTLVTGIRYTREETTIDGTTNAGLNDVSGIEDIPATLLVPGGIDSINSMTSVSNPTNDGITSNKHVDTDTNWKLGLNYFANDDVMLFFTAQTGFRTGGFSVPFGGSVVEFEKEEVTSLEAGFKSRLMSNRVQLNGAIFNTVTDNAQVNVDDPISPVVPITRNIPEVTSFGAELDLQFAVSSDLTANFGVSYLDSEVTDSGGATIATIAATPTTPIDGNRPINTPEWQFNGGFQFQRPISNSLAFTASADVRWVDDRFLEITNEPADAAPSYTVANARIGLASLDDKWDISLFVKNLSDEDYLVYTNNLPGPGFKLDIFGERRTVGLAAGVRF